MELIREDQKREAQREAARKGQKPPIIMTPPTKRELKYHRRYLVNALWVEQLLEKPIVNPRQLVPQSLHDVDMEWMYDRAYILKLKEYLADESRRVAELGTGLDLSDLMKVVSDGGH